MIDDEPKNIAESEWCAKTWLRPLIYTGNN